MRLTDIKKNADTKIAETKAKQDETSRLINLNVHPLVKWKCDRNAREAYFQGIAFAALTDNLEFDASELKVIKRIGSSLAIPIDDQNAMMQAMQTSIAAMVNAGDEKASKVFSFLEECVHELKDENVVRIFVVEYIKVCAARKLDAEDVVERQIKTHIVPNVCATFSTSFLKKICHVIAQGAEMSACDLVAFADALGDDLARYFMLDVVGEDIQKRLSAERKRANAAALRCAKKKQERIAEVRKNFNQVSRSIGELWKSHASLPNDYDEMLRERLSDYDEHDIDYVECVNRFLMRLQKDQDDLWGTKKTWARRIAVLKLMCLVYVSGETVDCFAIDDLLRGASRLTDTGYVEKVESLIRSSLAKFVVLK